MLDAWIYAKPAAWDAYLLSLGELPYSLQPGHVKTGFWLPYLTDYEVYNILASEADVDSIVTALGVDCAGFDAWGQGIGVGVFEDRVGQPLPARVLAVMKDHPGGVTPTFADPNWGHLFLGQKERKFARSFSNEFSGEFI